jgi:tRNA A-37 threonylcarbamoyl transferase component Bud32
MEPEGRGYMYKKETWNLTESQIFDLCSGAGLSPRFISHEWDGHKGELLVEQWPEDLLGWSYLWRKSKITPAMRDNLVEGLKKLPSMLEDLHTLGVVHMDLFSRNIVARINPNPDITAFDVAFIDFGLSKFSSYPPWQKQDKMTLRYALCCMGRELNSPELCCKTPGWVEFGPEWKFMCCDLNRNCFNRATSNPQPESVQTPSAECC